MSTLGEAYIEVRADTRPFARDLERQLKVIVADAEKNLHGMLGRTVGDGAQRDGEKAGEDFSEGFSRKTKQKVGDKDKEPWLTLTAALASALDDGISALPSELKAGIVIALAAASPLIVGGLAGLIAAGVAAGTAGLGTALAAQYQDVRDAGADFFTELRDIGVRSAAAFGPVLLEIFDRVLAVVGTLEPKLTRIFNKAAQFVEPLTDGLIDGISFFLDSLEAGLNDADGLVAALADGIRVLGLAFGYAFEALASTGKDGEVALRDLLYVVASLIAGTGEFLAMATHVYAAIRAMSTAIADSPILSILLPLGALFGTVSGSVDKLNGSIGGVTGSTAFWREANNGLANSFSGVITATEAQERRLKELNKQIDDAIKNEYELLDANIAWQRSLDSIREALQNNGATLDLNTEAGRRNSEEFIRGLRAAEQRAQERLQAGELNAEQASRLYDKEIAKLRDLAGQVGIGRKEFDKMFGAAIEATKVKFTTVTNEVRRLAEQLARASSNAHAAQQNLLSLAGKTGRRYALADGGIFHSPTNALIAEAGPEVVIPLSKPDRAARLARESGLLALLGSVKGMSAGFGTPTAGPVGVVGVSTQAQQPVIYVMIDGQQLDARIEHRIEQQNLVTARSLAAGPRSL